ncbi:MAG: hypothetical protein R3F23_05755 [Verrucomicrobiia bacterium]
MRKNSSQSQFYTARDEWGFDCDWFAKCQIRKSAKTVAKGIGKVVVDHGETGCKTPDAVSYIEKIKAWRNRKQKEIDF